MACLQWSTHHQSLYCAGKIFEPQRLDWYEAEGTCADEDLADIQPTAALRRYAETGRLRRVPIAIIGPRAASPHQCNMAEALGRSFALHGLQLICGGKNGVMEAACKGHAQAGGLPVGILPDEEWQAANPYVAIPIATGIGPARNALIARAALVLVAVGGGVGTVSEMALGLQFGRLVLALEKSPYVEGVEYVATIEKIMEKIAERIFAIK